MDQKALLYEQGKLSEAQRGALQRAIFLTFTPEEAAAYDLRAARIEEIRKLIAERNSEDRAA